MYRCFPELSCKHAQLATKKVKVLQRQAEHRRKHDTKNQLHVVDLAVTALSPRRSSIVRKDSMLENMFGIGEAQFSAMMAALILIQRRWKVSVARRRYLRQRHVVDEPMSEETQRLYRHGLAIQKIIRGYLVRLGYRRSRAATLLQATVRGSVKKRQFERLRRGVERLQAIARMRVTRKTYKNAILHFSILQSTCKAKRTFRDFEGKRPMLVLTLRKVIFQLWDLAGTPLEYRSQFWSFVDRNNFLHLSFHIDEVKSLWKKLHYDPSVLKCLSYPDIFSSLYKLEQFVEGKYISSPDNQDIEAERKKFYTLMKSGVKNATDQSRYFDSFGISKAKKRKQDLTKKLLWRSVDTADISATVVLDLLDTPSLAQEDWIKKHNAVRAGSYSMLSVVQALIRMQKTP